MSKEPDERVRMRRTDLGRQPYEPPRLEVLGDVEALTETIDKKYGRSDGFTLMGVAIMNASP
jgi:hypothetical protein